MKTQINLIELYIRMIFIFPLTTLLQGYVSSINRITSFILLLTAIYLVLKQKYQSNNIIFILLTFLTVFISIITTGTMPYNINIVFYFIGWVLNVVLFTTRSDQIKNMIFQNRRFVLLITLIWEALVVVSFFLPSSYVHGAGVTSFASFTGDTFRLCTSTFQILAHVFILMICYHEKKSILLLLVPIITVFMCGSRTYFVIGAVLSILCLYRFFNDRRLFIASLVPLIIISVYFVGKSAIGDKFHVTNQIGYYGYLATFTSGRSDFWLVDIASYFDGNLFNKLLGYGFNKSIDVNYARYGNRIWSHNDFIECLLTGGLIQLSIYLASIKKLFSFYANERNRFFIISLLGVWFFDAFFNMFYTYFGTSLGLLLTVCFVDYVKKDKVRAG